MIKDSRLFLDVGTHWARLRLYLASPLTHAMKAPYAVVLTFDSIWAQLSCSTESMKDVMRREVWEERVAEVNRQ